MKKIRIILVTSIVVLIILIISLFIYARTINNQVQNNNQNENIDEQSISKEEYEAKSLEEKLYPNNFTEFYFKYKGKINTNEIYPKLYEVVVEDIPKIYSDIDRLKSSEDIEKYYSKNGFLSNMGITSSSDFSSLVTVVKKLNGSKLEYTISEVEKQSTVSYADRTEFVLKITYNDNQNLKLKITIYNSRRNNKFIKIIPVTEE